MGDPRYMLILSDLPGEAIERIGEVAAPLRVQRVRRDEPAYVELLPRAEVIVGGLWPEDVGGATSLRWLQIGSAGANRILDLLPAHVILTNASGVFGIPIAEHVLAMMLALVRQIPQSVLAANQARWSQQVGRVELYGTTCGIIGLGDIGTEVARRAKAFGMRVLAVKRQASVRPDFVDELRDITGLDRLLAESDHIVNCLPGTAHTFHLLDAGRIGLMKRGARLYNIGRGNTLDEAALVAALESGRLAGAGLDVFEQEPLPADSPLWRMANVIVTPHRSGQSPCNGQRLAEIVLRNAGHYARGEPLENVVDRHWGY
jgi:phosphoglycerate dehydrogenase-like enzyme